MWRLTESEVVMKVWGLSLALLCGVAGGQLARREDSAPAAGQQVTRTRLYLTNGSFQVVTSYRVLGDRVSYVSAERGGEREEIPLKLVDLAATQKWARDHDAIAAGERPSASLDPELAKEEVETSSAGARGRKKSPSGAGR